jgi:hypothetical protein
MASPKDSSSAEESGFPQWQLEYESALQETDRKALFKRIEVAEATILARREVLMQSSDGFSERQALKVSLEKLRNLKKEVLKFP